MGLETGNFDFKPISSHKHELRALVKTSKRRAGRLPKEFDYYCPGCLHQTNEYSRRCPECKKQRLLKTGEEGFKEFISDDWYMEKDASKYLTYFTLGTALVLFSIFLATWHFFVLFNTIFWTLILIIIDLFLMKVEATKKNMYTNTFKTNNYIVTSIIEDVLKNQKIKYSKLGPSNWLATFPIFISETFQINGQDWLIKVEKENQGYTMVMLGPVKQSNKKYVEDMKKILNIAFNDIE